MRIPPCPTASLTSPLATCLSATMACLISDTTKTISWCMTISSPRRSTRCARAVSSPLSLQAAQWTRRTPLFGSTSHREPNCLARCVCRTTPSCKTREHRWSQTFSFYRSVTEPSKPNRNGCISARAPRALPSTSISRITPTWYWDSLRKKAHNTAGRNVPVRPSPALTFPSSFVTLWRTSTALSPSMSARTMSFPKAPPRASPPTPMCGTSPLPSWTGRYITARTAA